MADPKAPTNENVLIVCKLPHGLNLDLYHNPDAVNRELRARVKLGGTAFFRVPNPDRKFVNPESYAGSSITPVPRKHWEEWLELHKNHPALVRGFVYAVKTEDDARARAREFEKEQNGFEQLDPTKQPGLTKLDTNPKPIEAR